MEFKIGFANHIVSIRTKYDYLYNLCREYIVSDGEAEFLIECEKNAKEKYSKYIKQFGSEVAIEVGCEYLSVFSQLEERFIDCDETFIHAALCAVDGIGYGFMAPSGTGKTTHIMLWKKLFGEKCEIINGDHPLVGVKTNRVYASGTPWCGKERFSINKTVPVKAMAFLERSETNSIERLTPTEAEKRLYYSIILSGGMTEDIMPTIRLMNRLSRSIDFYVLRCNMDIEAAQVAYKTMSGGFYNET